MHYFKRGVQASLMLYAIFVYGRISGFVSSVFSFPHNCDRSMDSFQIWQVYAVALGNVFEYAAMTTNQRSHDQKCVFTPQPLIAVGVHGVRMGWRREKVCPGCISETVRCRKLILSRDIG